MEPFYSCESGKSAYPAVHHHHHHHHLMILYPHIHRHHHHHFHSKTNLCLVPHHHHCYHHHHQHQAITFPSQVTGSSAPLRTQNHLNSRFTVVQNESLHSADLDLASEEQDYEEEEEPIFVLTDEWREFFAKSEAKRRLDKMQTKKKQKN